MGFESWGTKCGMVVLHGDVKNSELAFFDFCFFRTTVKVEVKVEVAKKYQKHRKITLKNEK